MPLTRKGSRFALGLAIGAAAVGVTFITNRLVDAPFLVFYTAAFAAAWYAERDGGFVVIAIGLVATPWLLHGGRFLVDGPTAFVMAVFMVSAFVIVQLVTRLHEAIAARESLLSTLTHDIKSPLAAIVLQEQSLRRRGTIDRGQVEEHANRVERQIEQVLFLVNNLLDAARLRARRLRLHREVVDLRQVVDGVIERFRPHLDHGSYQIGVEQDGRSMVGAWDPIAVEQIVSNLLSNAIKYGGGKPIEIRLGGDARAIWLEVQDHGKGISEVEQRGIFGKFETSGDGRGHSLSHGLGLWIVRHLVDAHGGGVSVRSARGKGATFRVELPRRLSEETQSRPARRPA